MRITISEKTATLAVECLRFTKHEIQSRKDPATLKKAQTEMINAAINEIMENVSGDTA